MDTILSAQILENRLETTLANSIEIVALKSERLGYKGCYLPRGPLKYTPVDAFSYSCLVCISRRAPCQRLRSNHCSSCDGSKRIRDMQLIVHVDSLE